ncbi:amidohydrolase family protein [Reichenbachiella ulvae]|uniref:Amidohydrolase family protein n=1 Tax=Reichenbachiella ulvae TaxID=2980104 RepID=A0ABT3CT32_9BACT|nr:amidohydrolase family protein [Reichenbachiella ulvae]MCV9386838.1 amidohydrolase family protein [Reichenbachiella ulvae]
MRIDAHQHFWQFDPVRDAWIDDSMQVIRRDFLPADLAPLLEEKGVDGCVAVQADQSLDETRFLLNLAEENDWIKAVVGWFDLKAEDLEAQLDHFLDHKKLVGARHILEAEPHGFMSSPDFVSGVKKLARRGMTYDILSRESQLEEVNLLLHKLPEMKLVVDHMSKPKIKEASFDHWAKQMIEVAAHDHVTLKLSGLVTEADWSNWKKEDFIPYLDFCLDHFGPDRLMYGSDWPVCLLAGSYAQVHDLIQGYISTLSESEQAKIMGGTAAQFYGLSLY